MYLLGISGLADVEKFLTQHYPVQMSLPSKVVQGMDSAAALLCDGVVVAAAAEERFNRLKKSGQFPFEAIDYCLAAAGITMADVDAVCGNFDFGRYQVAYMSDEARAYWQACLSPTTIAMKLTDYYHTPVAFFPIDHHDAHLHSALASADFDNCLAIVMDAAGEIGATSVYHVTDGTIVRDRRYPIRQSLGMLYSLITQFLGFAFNEDEYKVMGLAARGNPERFGSFFEHNIILGPGGGIRIPLLELNHGFDETLFFTQSSRAIEDGLGFDGRTCEMALRADVSAALQQRFSEALFHIAAHYRKVTGATNLLLSGGCAENCAAVGELRSTGLFDRIHVAYASGDDGTALGAALARSAALDQRVRMPKQMPFYGPAPDIEEVRALAEQHGLKLHEFANEADMLRAAAEDIAADRIVGLCHGRMEYGARALGNRSLLALPSYAANRDRINTAIKKRENYRPFAPAVLIEDASRFFDLQPGEDYPYMTMLTHVREPYVDRLPAITHFDGTARVQTVDRQYNPAFHQLLSNLKELTGFGVVLNTSYNVNHQPIVCSELEAIETFIAMKIDALYIANAKITA